ncbi:MAG: hydroxymethylbilane synthase [Longimonas sp.]|uniref:hydroxymethylbilane synthase n=1 Tax=Longimonas sp. TaxID=2039626 RepID=UPI003976FA13
MSDSASLVIGTRGSTLALWQARRIQKKLHRHGHESTLQRISTRGDRVQDVPISEIGDESVFTKELDRALLDGRIDCAVHSLKDLPSRLPEGIALAAVGRRASPFDAFVAHPDTAAALHELPEGATVATASLRRRAQLLAWRSDLTVVPVRGNVDSRLDTLAESDWHGMVLAVAGLKRLGRGEVIRTVIPPDIMVPAVGQGALAITCRTEASQLRTLLRGTVHDLDTATAITAERSFMKRIEGGCQVPTGAWARLNEAGELAIDGCVAALDGHTAFRAQKTTSLDKAAAVGAALAQELLDAGGAEVLDTIRTATQ